MCDSAHDTYTNIHACRNSLLAISNVFFVSAQKKMADQIVTRLHAANRAIESAASAELKKRISSVHAKAILTLVSARASMSPEDVANLTLELANVSFEDIDFQRLQYALTRSVRIERRGIAIGSTLRRRQQMLQFVNMFTPSQWDDLLAYSAVPSQKLQVVLESCSSMFIAWGCAALRR